MLLERSFRTSDGSSFLRFFTVQSMTDCDGRWDFSHLDSRVAGIQDPIGYRLDDGNAAGKTSKGINKDLLEKKAWEVAVAPIQSLGMNFFFLWMSGSSPGIFTIMIYGYCLTSIVGQFAKANVAFQSFKTIDTTLQWLAYLALSSVSLAYLLYHMAGMGLLPSSSGDWIALIPKVEVIEQAGGIVMWAAGYCQLLRSVVLTKLLPNGRLVDSQSVKKDQIISWSFQTCDDPVECFETESDLLKQPFSQEYMLRCESFCISGALARYATFGQFFATFHLTHVSASSLAQALFIRGSNPTDFESGTLGDWVFWWCRFCGSICILNGQSGFRSLTCLDRHKVLIRQTLPRGMFHVEACLARIYWKPLRVKRHSRCVSEK